MNMIRQHCIVWTIGLVFFSLVVALIVYACVYQRGLHPKLVYECSIEHAITVCSKLSEWVRERKPGEWVPFNMFHMLYDKQIPDNKCLFATYEARVVRFIPHEFHAVKGEFEETPGATNTIYVYTCNKRYAASVYAP